MGEGFGNLKRELSEGFLKATVFWKTTQLLTELIIFWVGGPPSDSGEIRKIFPKLAEEWTHGRR